MSMFKINAQQWLSLSFENFKKVNVGKHTIITLIYINIVVRLNYT